MKEIAIEVTDLSVTYKSLKAYSIKKMLLRGKTNKNDSFQAVKNVTFSVPKGEIWGIIGRNGSGKSTLLKAIGGIFSPDSGTVDLKGHTVSLLAIGAGFKVNLTGRENIMLVGMLLGFSEKEIKEKMQGIIEFSELGDFIDKPVRTYSSGMHSKLAFSITAILETDIMLVDEVLSVGDEHFKKKSLNKMRSLIGDENRTVLIVSHSIPTLQELCTRVMWMHDGEIKMIGEPGDVLAQYSEFMK
jgi:ABC-type polysaccharide/polyol phosphate transport system ATPase subunit